MLFGSTAKETYKEDSDIDILLVGNKKIQTKEAEKEVDALTAIRISTFQMTYKEFITENVVAYSTAKHVRSGDSSIMVGALARLNNNYSNISYCPTP